MNNIFKSQSGKNFLLTALCLAAGAAALYYMAFMHKQKQEEPLKEMFTVMGTVAEIKLYGDLNETQKAAAIVRDTFKTIETTCSTFNPESELSKLNATAAKEPFKCSELLWEILKDSREMYNLSNHAFDITAKPLMSLWGFYRKRNSIPSDKEIVEALEKVGLDKVRFDDNTKTVFFTKEGLAFDLGGIAKGIAVDKALDRIMKETAVRSGIVNLAGNMRCLPLPPPGKNTFSIGIRNPLNKEITCGVVQLSGNSVATSGDYERYVVLDGKKVTHIMNVKTGRPVENMLSVTVVTPLAGLADGLSTSVFINGSEFAKEICERIPGTSILIIRHPNDDINKLEVIKYGKVWNEINL